MDLNLIALIMGIVEGLTEYLPISSTGHLILVGSWLGFTGETAKIFEVFIQLGSILAIAVLYRHRFYSFLTLAQFQKKGLNLLHIFLGILPAAVLGFVFYDWIKTLFSPYVVVFALLAGAILMIAAQLAKRKVTAESLDQLTYRQAFLIGLFQTLALWPGFSRAGATISGGLLLGASYKTAAEFSFLVAVPIMFGTTGFDLIKNLDVLHPQDFGVFAIGFVTAFVVAMLAVVTFLKVLNRLKLIPFAIYRILLAGVLFYYLYF
ncbi:undecaprenyl-diphosphate phosphatase [Thermicanus aegyptius]|uniref:undecaprenyl-diphosphate phosphatase n=1 Tax=Thermicanus aegyptius TaxID=94009 RepID=UPI00040B2AA5|nr:undecaprenyl-diphosphate phosphatase [Thermicanus aegyptius]